MDLGEAWFEYEDLYGDEFASALMDDEETVIAGIMNFGGDQLERASDRLKDHVDVVMAAINHADDMEVVLKFVSDRLLNNIDIIMAAIERADSYYVSIVLNMASDRPKNNKYPVV